MKGKWIAGIAAVIICVAAGWAIFAQKPAVPAFSVPTLAGKPVSLAQLSGKVVLVNFWATTCTTCVSEMPQLTETYRKYTSRGYDMVAIAMDYDRPDWVLNFATRNKLPFTVALDMKGEAARAFGGVRLTPTSFLIDRQGRIVQQYLGRPDSAQFEATLERLLADS